MRIHWAPFWVPNDLLCRSLQAALPPGAKLEGIGNEKSALDGLHHINTMVRYAIVEHQGSPDLLPHLMQVQEKVEVLLTIQGRKPLCLRCKRVGHIRQQCDALYCVACRGYGHEKEECLNRFTSALMGRHSADAEVDEAADEVEMAVVTAPVEEQQRPQGAEQQPEFLKQQEQPATLSDSQVLGADEGKRSETALLPAQQVGAPALGSGDLSMSPVNWAPPHQQVGDDSSPPPLVIDDSQPGNSQDRDLFSSDAEDGDSSWTSVSLPSKRKKKKVGKST